MCQDTGTAIVMGKKSEGVLTGADDAEAISLGVYDAYTRLNLRYSQLAPLTMWEEKNTGTNLPAQIELYSTPSDGHGPGVQVPLHGQGRRLGQQVLPLPGDEGGAEPEADAAVPRREAPLARHGRLPAVPPGRRHRRHLGGVRAEDREVRLGALPRQPADVGIPVGARVPRPRARGGGLQADAVVRDRRAVRRQVLLPRRPRRPAAAARRLVPGRDRRVVLGRPAGAGQDHAPRASSSSSSRPTRPSTCRTPAWPRTSRVGRWCRSTSTGRWPRSSPSCPATRSRPGCR